MSEFLSWMLTNQELIGLGKETQVRSPLAKIGQKVIGLMKKMLGIETNVGKDLFSNIRFNAEIVTRVPVEEAIAKADARTLAIFEQVYGRDEELEALERTYLDRLAGLMRRREKDSGRFRGKTTEVFLAKGMTAAEAAQAAGYVMNDREVAVFRAIHATMAAGFGGNASALRQAKRIYAKVIEEMPEGPRKAFLTGRDRRATIDRQSDILPSFMALAQTSKSFRAELDKMDAPKMREETASPEEGTIDTWLKRIATEIVEWLSKMSISRKALPTNAREQVDALSTVIGEIQVDRRLSAEVMAFNFGDRLNRYFSGALDKGSKKATAAIQRQRGKIRTPKGMGKYQAVGLEAAALVTSLGSREETASRVGARQE